MCSFPQGIEYFIAVSLLTFSPLTAGCQNYGSDPGTQAASGIIYASPTGTPMASGTKLDPLDLRSAVARVRLDTVVELLGGIYRIPTQGLARSAWVVYLGNDVAAAQSKERGGKNSIIRTAAGERAIITRDNGYPPHIALQPYTRLENIWMGGTKDPDQNGGVVAVAHDAEMEGCVIFGYYGGIADGGESHNLYRGNLFVNCGTGELYHSLYISGQPTDPTRGCTVERNVFVGGGGYHIHMWHSPQYTKVLNNFSGDAYYSLVMDGNGIVVRDNILWSNRGQPTIDQGDNTITVTFKHNLFGRMVTYYSWANCPGCIADSNGFVTGGIQHPFGTNQFFFPESESTKRLGAAAPEIDTAINELESTFSLPLERVLTDTSIAFRWNQLVSVLESWRLKK